MTAEKRTSSLISVSWHQSHKISRYFRWWFTMRRSRAADENQLKLHRKKISIMMQIFPHIREYSAVHVTYWHINCNLYVYSIFFLLLLFTISFPLFGRVVCASIFFALSSDFNVNTMKSNSIDLANISYWFNADVNCIPDGTGSAIRFKCFEQLTMCRAKKKESTR